jgi:soluble lytic murein transglycosylase
VVRCLPALALLLTTCVPVQPVPPPPGIAAQAAAALRMPVIPEPVIEVTPYFADGATALARKALDEEAPARAIELLQTAGTSLPVRWLRAQALWKAGRLDAASEELELLSIHYTAMHDRCLFDLGQVDEQRRDAARAEAAYEKVSPSSYVFADARFALARLLRARGQFAQAAGALVPVAGIDVAERVKARALWERSELAHAGGDRRAEHEVLNQLAVSASTRWARSAWARLGAMPAAAILSQADALLDRGKCTDAARAADRALSGGTACFARLLRAEADSCRGQDVEADLYKLATTCGEPEHAARAWTDLGLAQGHREAWAEAARSLRQAANLVPDTPAAAEGLFQAFWVGWKRDPRTAVVTDLEQLEAMKAGITGQERARARYWRGRVALSRGDIHAASTLMAEVAMLYPATFYGRLARGRLDGLDAELANQVMLPPAFTLTDPPRGKVPPPLAPGVEAVRLGIPDAANELVALARKLPSRTQNHLVVEVLQAAGEPRAAHLFSRGVLREQLGGAEQDELLWAAAFPPAYSDAVARYAGEGKVPATFLQAIVREESAFNPAARSHVGALGLTQLMPKTAFALAREVGRPLGDWKELLDPERNLDLGAHYLGQMLSRFGGESAYAAAAYNGGPTRVARWLKQRPDVPLEEWVEEIPFDETRNYVKDVLASEDVYRHRLMGHGTGPMAGR